MSTLCFVTAKKECRIFSPAYPAETFFCTLGLPNSSVRLHEICRCCNHRGDFPSFESYLTSKHVAIHRRDSVITSACSANKLYEKRSQRRPVLYLCGVLYTYFHHRWLRWHIFSCMFSLCVCVCETKQFPTPVVPADARLLSPCLGQMAPPEPTVA